jgi:hypothetical protein
MSNYVLINRHDGTVVELNGTFIVDLDDLPEHGQELWREWCESASDSYAVHLAVDYGFDLSDIELVVDKEAQALAEAETMSRLKAIGADVVVRYLNENEEGKEFETYISFGVYDEEKGTDSFGVRDDLIFFYCESEEDIKSLMTAGAEDFIVLNYDLLYTFEGE